MSFIKVLPLLIILGTLLTGCPMRSQSGGYQNYDKDRHVAAVVEVGVVAMNTGNYAKALEALSEAEKMDPRNPNIKQQMGRTFFRMKEYDKALTNYNEALVMNPKLTDVHNDLGLLYYETKEYAKAREEFNICISDLSYGNSALSRFNLALVEEAEGNTQAASKIYQELIASGEPSAAPYYRLAFLAYREANYRHAADLLDAAVRIDPNSADAYFLLGETYEKLELPDDAAQAYGQAVNLNAKSLRGIEAQRRIREIMKDYKP
ncbi:MAG: tetratricopeptide repeat protein [Deltaproteobacteria bacterium]|jgi:Tfp pilus assembly protein PilF|nr:tetratricopeptide repeat protein [Deltaproteobacteria bacterium]